MVQKAVVGEAVQGAVSTVGVSESEEKRSTSVEKLLRVAKFWKCENCGRLYGAYPEKCECGQFPARFSMVEEEVPDTTSTKLYRAVRDFLYQGKFIGTGTVIRLQEKDELTTDILKRGLVKEVSLGAKETKAS